MLECKQVGHAVWFERLLAELNIELWTGDSAKIAPKRVRRQKTPRQDAQHILRLMVKGDFPKIPEAHGSSWNTLSILVGDGRRI